jgi:cellulose synthase/poly-beta-1,6-N-acetylglucosamine synthase-like glycosyltransferase
MTPSASKTRRLAALALFGVAAVGPIGYPLWLAYKTRHLEDPKPPEPSEWPGVSVIIPAYREREVIAAKVENTLQNGYPGPIEAIVIAEDKETANAARETPARVLGEGRRLGKAGALNNGVRAAKMPIVIFTDANAMVESGGFEKLVRWLDDSSVGAAVGEKGIATTGGESFYWAFESWLKRRENRTGTTIGATGELAALRRDEYAELPENLAVDDLWLALDIMERGDRIVYEPGARVSEDEYPSTGAEWERRTRIVAGANDVLWRRRRLLVPRNSPIAGQLWGHRLVRQSFGPMAHAGLVLIALGSMRKSRLARGFLALHAFGAYSLVRQHRARSSGRFGHLAAQVLFLQAVGIGGTFRWACGDRPALWPKPERVLRECDDSEVLSGRSSSELAAS